jgi:hypothetical protein
LFKIHILVFGLSTTWGKVLAAARCKVAGVGLDEKRLQPSRGILKAQWLCIGVAMRLAQRRHCRITNYDY